MHASILKVKLVYFVTNMDCIGLKIRGLNANTAIRNIAYLNLKMIY